MARFPALAGILATLFASGALADTDEQVKTKSGVVEGVNAASPGVRVFRGIPFAAPPIGKLRWKPPQPAKHWKGVRKAAEFGPRCMQAPVFPDMIFRDRADKPMSEDWNHRRQRQLPAGALWFSFASGTDEGIACARVRKLWPDGPNRGFAVGERKHRCVWRRSGKSDYRRRIGGIALGERTDGVAAGQRIVSRGHRRKRRFLWASARRIGDAAPE